MAASPDVPTRSAPPRWERPRRWYRALNQLRWLCVGLVLLAGVGVWELGASGVLAQLLVCGATASLLDLGLSAYRFRRVRFPWAGLATGLFVALLLPPQGSIGPVFGNVLLFAGATTTALGIFAKHLLRTRGRPWFNPASLAMVAAATLFGVQPAWWGVVSLPALGAVGLAVNARSWRRWTLPASFFAAFSGIGLMHFTLVAHVTDPRILFLSVVDPSVVFFTLLMVPEPRSAPADPALWPVHGLVAGLVAGTLGFVAVGGGSLVGSEALFLGLLAANLVAVPLRVFADRRPVSEGRARPSAPGRARRPDRFGIPARVGVAFAAFVLLVVSVQAVGPPPAAPGVAPHLAIVSCTTDNRSIPSGQLAMLHQRLGPSVIFSYDARSGATEFYDPANHVTVYETDLFEDYGSAEFNGDDAIVASGCSPAGGVHGGS